MGLQVLQILHTHAKEVMYLVQKNRPTMVCWQRHQGPAFIRSVVDSGFEEEVEFVKEVKGIKIESLILNMAEVLQDNGTPELKRTIGQYAPTVLRITREASSLREVIHRINHTQIEEQHG